jgi:hypothetical protein
MSRLVFSELDHATRMIKVFLVLRLIDTLFYHSDEFSEVSLIHLESIPVIGIGLSQIVHGFHMEHFLHIEQDIYELMLARLPIFEFEVQIYFVV